MNGTTVASGHELILIDEDYDHSRASDGFSRFGAYLSTRLPVAAGDDPDILTSPVRWAAFAWATAAPPVMFPGYVTWNDPIEDIELSWDDGRLVAEVVIRTELPAHLVGWRSWDRDGDGHLVEPWHADRVALSRLSLRTPLEVCLPEAPGVRGTHRQYVTAAKETIAVVASAMATELPPVLHRLRGCCSCRLEGGRQA